MRLLLIDSLLRSFGFGLFPGVEMEGAFSDLVVIKLSPSCCISCKTLARGMCSAA